MERARSVSEYCLEQDVARNRVEEISGDPDVANLMTPLTHTLNQMFLIWSVKRVYDSSFLF